VVKRALEKGVIFMKKIMLLLMVLGCLPACNVVGTSANETMNQRFDRQQREQKIQQAQADQVMAAQYAGGQPGKIFVKGILVADSENKAQLDNRIQVSQTVGTSYKTALKMNPSAIDKNAQALLTPTADSLLTENLAQDKTYVALGCSSVDPSLISGLSKKSVEALSGSVAAISANTVIFCGKTDIKYSSMTVAAHHLILINAEISAKNAVGALSLIADHLVVIGKNKIQTQGLDANVSVLPAPALELSVLTAIDGEGSLKLSSVGGNCTNK